MISNAPMTAITWTLRTVAHQPITDTVGDTATAWAGALDAAAVLIRAGHHDRMVLTVAEGVCSITPERSERGGEHDQLVSLRAVDELRSVYASIAADARLTQTEG